MCRLFIVCMKSILLHSRSWSRWHLQAVKCCMNSEVQPGLHWIFLVVVSAKQTTYFRKKILDWIVSTSCVCKLTVYSFNRKWGSTHRWVMIHLKLHPQIEQRHRPVLKLNVLINWTCVLASLSLILIVLTVLPVTEICYEKASQNATEKGVSRKCMFQLRTQFCQSNKHHIYRNCTLWIPAP